MAEQQLPEQRRLAWHYLAHSEIGLVRKNNQDSGLVSPRMLMVADGMGGAAAGDLASAVAVDTMIGIDQRLAGPPPPESAQPETARPETASPESDRPESDRPETADALELLAAGISAANTRIADLVATDYALEGMGTTLTAVVLDGADVSLAHIGDSRAYLFRNGELAQLTHDHSWVQSLIDDGKISESEAATHPHRSLLLKVLNGQPANEPDLSTVPLLPGDRLMLCSDGLCGFVEDAEIAAAMAGTDREQAMERLVAAAHAAGGLDNITVILADLVAADVTPAAVATANEEQLPPPAGSRPETTNPSQARQSGAPDAAPASGDADRPGDATASEDGESTGVGESTGDTGEITAAVGRARVITLGDVSTEILGAAAEHDLVADEEAIRQHVADREAGELDDDDEYDDYEADDEDRYAPQAPAKRRWRRPLIITVALVLIIGAAAAVGYSWTRTQYYVGAKNADVAIFQGLSQSVPGLRLSRVYEVQDLQLADLPAYYQGLVRATIDTGTLDSARATVAQLRETAARCATPPPSTTPTSPKASPTSKKPTGKSSPGKKPTTKSSPGKKSTSKKPTTKTSPTAKQKSPAAKPTGSATPQTSRPTPNSPSQTATTTGQLPQSGRC